MLTVILVLVIFVLFISTMSLFGIVASGNGGQRRDAAAQTLDYAQADLLRAQARATNNREN